MPIDQSDNSYKLDRVRHSLRALAVKAALLRLRSKAGFNPAQPRVPAGRREGGRWAGGGRSSQDGPSPTRSDSAVSVQNVVRDETGERSWSSYTNNHAPNGEITSRVVSNRNGSSIVADYSVPGTERNTVVLRDQTRITFENSGDTQRIFNGSDQLVSEAVWGSNGPVSQPIVRQAFSDRGRIGRGLSPLSYPAEVIVDAATELYNWWLSTKEPGEETVFTFRADKLLRDIKDEPPTWISNLRREEVEAACPRFPVVQQIVNSSAAPLKRNMFKNDGAYGTAVHMSVKRKVDALGDPNLKTELSIIKSNSAETKYGTKGSVRIDIL